VRLLRAMQPKYWWTIRKVWRKAYEGMIWSLPSNLEFHETVQIFPELSVDVSMTIFMESDEREEAIGFSFFFDAYRSGLTVRQRKRWFDPALEARFIEKGIVAEIEAHKGGTCTLAGFLTDDAAFAEMVYQNERLRLIALEELRLPK